jgi:hypothetical protein
MTTELHPKVELEWIRSNAPHMQPAYRKIVFALLAELERAERERDEEKALRMRLLDAAEILKDKLIAVPALVEALRPFSHGASGWQHIQAAREALKPWEEKTS